MVSLDDNIQNTTAEFALLYISTSKMTCKSAQLDFLHVLIFQFTFNMFIILLFIGEVLGRVFQIFKTLVHKEHHM